MQAIINNVNSENYLKRIGGKTIFEKQIISLIKNNVCRILLIGSQSGWANKIIQKKFIAENAQIDFVKDFKESVQKTFMNSFFVNGAFDLGKDSFHIEKQDRIYSFFNRQMLFVPLQLLKKSQSSEELFFLPHVPFEMTAERKNTCSTDQACFFCSLFKKISSYLREKRAIRAQYKKIKACLFDFDGTLVDDMDDFADLAAKTIERYYGVPFTLARKKYVEFTGLPFILQLHAIFPGALRNEEVSNDFETAKESIFFSKHIEPGVRKTLNWLKQKGIKISVTSGGFKDSIDEFCKKEGIEFDLIMGYEKGFEKGPTHFAHLLKTFQLKKEEVLFMGDSLKDAEKGLSYGFRFIAKCGLFSKKDFLEKFKGIETINCISELRKRLK